MRCTITDVKEADLRLRAVPFEQRDLMAIIEAA